jgi:hypothetical protein
MERLKVALGNQTSPWNSIPVVKLLNFLGYICSKSIFGIIFLLENCLGQQTVALSALSNILLQPFGILLLHQWICSQSCFTPR